jgi:hypothetical protein
MREGAGMKGRWKLWAAVLALVLLALGFGVAWLWPLPSEAEKEAALIRPGMTLEQLADLQLPAELMKLNPTRDGVAYIYRDGSTLFMEFTLPVEGELIRIATVRTTPPTPVPHPTRLRRTLARVLPFLGE